MDGSLSVSIPDWALVALRAVDGSLSVSIPDWALVALRAVDGSLSVSIPDWALVALVAILSVDVSLPVLDLLVGSFVTLLFV